MEVNEAKYKGLMMPYPFTIESIQEMTAFFVEETQQLKPKHLHKKFVLSIVADVLKEMKKTKSGEYRGSLLSTAPAVWRLCAVHSLTMVFPPTPISAPATP